MCLAIYGNVWIVLPEKNFQLVGPLSSVPELLRRFGINPAEVLAVLRICCRIATCILGLCGYHPHVRGYYLICELVAIGGFNLVCELTGAEQKDAIQALLSRSELQDLAPYHHAFGVKLRFNALIILWRAQMRAFERFGSREVRRGSLTCRRVGHSEKM